MIQEAQDTGTSNFEAVVAALALAFEVAAAALLPLHCQVSSYHRQFREKGTGRTSPSNHVNPSSPKLFDHYAQCVLDVIVGY